MRKLIKNTCQSVCKKINTIINFLKRNSNENQEEVERNKHEHKYIRKSNSLKYNEVALLYNHVNNNDVKCNNISINQHSNVVNTSQFSKSFNIFIKNTSSDDFHILKLLGKGSFGKVILSRKKDDGYLYAIKMIDKEKIKTKDEKISLSEIEILEKIRFPFINELKFCFYTSDSIFMVSDYLPGGSLGYHLKNDIFFPELKAKFYICELILAIDFLHENSIIYRDLKPDNILISKFGHVKLVDFGLSKKLLLENKGRTYSICGTPEYLAPEMLLGNGYSYSVDWWSLGVLFYEILVGCSPFSEIKQAKKLDINLYFKHIQQNKRISKICFDFIERLLEVDPMKRLGGKTIKQHPYFKDINWNDYINLRVRPPFIPKLTSEEDVRYFDKYFTDSPTSNLVKSVKSLVNTPIKLQKNAVTLRKKLHSNISQDNKIFLIRNIPN